MFGTRRYNDASPEPKQRTGRIVSPPPFILPFVFIPLAYHYYYYYYAGLAR